MMNLTAAKSPKYKILYLVTGFPPDVSGVSLFNWERSTCLAKRANFEVVVLAPDWQLKSGDRPYPDTIPPLMQIDTYPSQPWLPYPVTHVPCFHALSVINDKIEMHQPDIVVITDVERLFLLSTWQLPGVKYAKANKVLFIAEYHTDLYNFSASYAGWQWIRFMAKFTRLSNRLYKYFDITLCSTVAAQKSCIDQGISNSRVLPYLGIDVSMYGPQLRNRECLLQWLSPHEREFTIFVYVGRIAHEKRVDYLIDAYSKLKHNFTNCSLMIIGDGPKDIMAHLHRMSSNTKDIHFTGYLFGFQKAQVMASCDVFCSPSPYETFGRTLVEAMASGLPVISVDSGAASEHVRSGENGYLVSPGDVSELVAAMERSINNTSVTITSLAVQQSQKFSLENSCAHLEEFYSEQLAERHSPQ